ncbi:Acb2/Tad1 domain-containing protein [Microbacterium trichothecenolyticum]
MNHDIADGRAKSLALTALEEALMWTGKAIFA